MELFENARIAVEVSNDHDTNAVAVRSEQEGNASLMVAVAGGILTVYATEGSVLFIPEDQNPNSLHVQVRPKQGVPDQPAPHRKAIFDPGFGGQKTPEPEAGGESDLEERRRLD